MKHSLTVSVPVTCFILKQTNIKKKGKISSMHVTSSIKYYKPLTKFQKVFKQDTHLKYYEAYA